MNEQDAQQSKESWEQLAVDWADFVGEEGDRNRFLNSDPVLWSMAGDVKGLQVLDAGCGTGYLSHQMHSKGADVTGVDISEQMIEISRKRCPEATFHASSISEMPMIADGAFDLVVSNYVMMDAPLLEETVVELHRVIRAGGQAVLVFSHPCFPQGFRSSPDGNKTYDYRWSECYFARHKIVERPWAHFKSDFVWFHRPLSDYWKAFRSAGFEIVEFEEPRIAEDRYHLLRDEQERLKHTRRPYSVAFQLKKSD